VDELVNGRRETESEREDRNLVELLQEVRVVQTGVQVLFGFLLAASFQPRFRTLSSFQRADYLGTLVAAAATLITLTAPTAFHRILFRLGDKPYLVRISNRFTIVGLGCMGLTTTGVVILLTDVVFTTAVTIIVTAVVTAGCVTTWCVLPVVRRRSLDGPRMVRRRPGAA
jgi:Family of unknown function (DUF6328)